MQKFWFVLFLGFCLVSRQLNAQGKNIKSEAAHFFEARNFKAAFDLYDKLSTENPTNLEYKFRLGYCALNYPDKKDRALEIFSDLKEVDKSPDINYYLAKAYHINYRFSEVTSFYRGRTNWHKRLKKSSFFRLLPVLKFRSRHLS